MGIRSKEFYMKLSFKGFAIEGVLNQDKRWYIVKNGQKSCERDGDPKELLRGSFKIDEYSIEYSAEEIKDLFTSRKDLTIIMVESLIPAVLDAVERIHKIKAEDRKERKRSENTAHK